MAQADLYNMSDVFISYSRKDSDFVHRLFDDIKATGKEVWADFEDIPKAANWWQEIQAGIDAADAFVFIISPASVQSDICRQEIDHAVNSNKRLLPVLYREITSDADKDKLHPAISSHNWIFFRETDDYQPALKTLLESLETDLDHNRTLTRLLVRAKEWQDGNHAQSLLLQGEDLEQAEDWMALAINKQPAPTNLHAEYIKASRTAAANRQRRLFSLAFAGMVVALLLAAFSVYQMYDAQRARDAAVRAQAAANVAREQAEESEQEARAIALAASSSEALANNNPDLALILAQEAVEVDDHLPSITAALADAAYAPGTVAEVPVNDIPATAVFASDGSLFAAGFFSGNICLYDGDTYGEIGCLMRSDNPAHDGVVHWIHMSEDNRRLLSSGSDDRLVYWDIDHDSSNYAMRILEVEIPGLRSSALSPDGQFAIYGTDNGVFGLWNIAANTTNTVGYRHGAAINVVALNPDASRALAGTNNGVMLEYDVDELVLINNYLNVNNLAPISSVAYSPDGTIGVSGDMDASLTSWDLNQRSIIRTYQGHDENVTAITFGDDGRTMFTSSWDNSVREWDVSSGRIVQEFFGHNGGINALSLSDDNLHMISGGFDGTMRIWLVHPVIFEEQVVSDDEALEAADWNDNHMVAANEDGEIFIYDRNTYQLLHEFDDINGTSGAISTKIRPDGRNFAVLYNDCSLTLFDMRGETLWRTTLADLSGCVMLEFRPGADELLVQSSETMYLLEGRSGDIITTIPDNPQLTADFLSFAFTNDGNQVLVGSNKRTENFHLLDLETGEIIREYVGHTDGVLAIDVSRDGTKLATGSFDNDVRVWDMASGELLALFEGHSDRVLSVDFHPDGTSVVSSSNDTTMRLWEIDTQITLYTYRLHTDRVVEARFSDDGRRILTASHDTTLIVWKFPQRLEELENWIEANRYLRDLSCGERNLYLSETNDCE